MIASAPADGTDRGSKQAGAARRGVGGFTLIEVLVVVAVIAVLLSILLPALTRARDSGRRVVCMSNQRQLWLAWSMYADSNAGKPVPHAAPNARERVYWYGAEDLETGRLDHTRGTLSDYLDAAPGDRSAYECPAQPEGSYREQGGAGGFTTTYGYNAYALAPATSGYADLSRRRWPAVHEFVSPSQLFVFGDSLLALHSEQPSNSALLDPPMLYQSRRGRWVLNYSPTTAFRHGQRDAGFGLAVIARGDGSVGPETHDPDAKSIEAHGIGSVRATNDPNYVPNWRRW